MAASCRRDSSHAVLDRLRVSDCSCYVSFPVWNSFVILFCPWEFGRSCEVAVFFFFCKKHKPLSTQHRPQGDVLHSSVSLWPWQISLSDSNDCNWTGTVPSHSALSITLDAICCFHVCVCECMYIFVWVSICVCVSVKTVPVRSSLAAGRCAGNRERQCECVGALVCLWDYEKLPACSAAWGQCDVKARKRWGCSWAWGGHHSSPQITVRHVRGEKGLTPWDAEHEKVGGGWWNDGTGEEDWTWAERIMGSQDWS